MAATQQSHTHTLTHQSMHARTRAASSAWHKQTNKGTLWGEGKQEQEKRKRRAKGATTRLDDIMQTKRLRSKHVVENIKETDDVTAS